MSGDGDSLRDTLEGVLEDEVTSRRAALAAIAAGGLGGGFGGGYLVFGRGTAESALSISPDVPKNVVVGVRADGLEPLVIPGEELSFDLVYSGLDGAGDEEFDVTVSIHPAFADEAEPITTGVIDAGSAPSDTVSVSLDDEGFEQDALDFADHSAVSDDYSEFGPGDDPVETDVDLEVVVESRTAGISASRTDTVTVTATHLVDFVVDIDVLRDNFHIDVDDGSITSMGITGGDVPIDIGYDGFGDDVAERADEFTVSLLARPEFADDFEVLATQSIDAGTTPADTVSGTLHDTTIDFADHSAISSTYSAFEPGHTGEKTTRLDLELRIESETYGVSVVDSATFVIIMTEEEDVSISFGGGRSRSSSDPDPEPDDPELTAGGQLILDGQAANEPVDPNSED